MARFAGGKQATRAGVCEIFIRRIRTQSGGELTIKTAAQIALVKQKAHNAHHRNCAI